MSWGKGSRRGTGEGKAREQSRLRGVRGGRQQRMSQERVSVGPQPHSRQLKRKRDCLAQITEKAQPGTSGLAPGIDLKIQDSRNKKLNFFTSI